MKNIMKTLCILLISVVGSASLHQSDRPTNSFSCIFSCLSRKKNNDAIDASLQAQDIQSQPVVLKNCNQLQAGDPALIEIDADDFLQIMRGRFLNDQVAADNRKIVMKSGEINKFLGLNCRELR